MQTFKIKSRWDGRTLYAADAETLRDVVQQAVREHADLRSADLSSADGKQLALIGRRPLLTIGPIGSRCDYLTAYLTDAGVYVRAGCFFDTIEAFRAAVVAEHGENEHGREYMAAIAMIDAHASVWTPVAVVAEAA